MRELVDDSFYELIKTYKRCIIDYCLMEDDTPHQGYQSHKDAILYAMGKVNERNTEYQIEIGLSSNEVEEPFLWSVDIEKANAERIDSVSFLHVPDETNHSEKRDVQNAIGDQIPYWYAFLETPHKPGYGKDDFVKINHVLFPNGAESLEVYEWTTDWSDYFDDGHEWWGAACWSVYDRSLKRYVVIMASTTD